MVSAPELEKLARRVFTDDKLPPDLEWVDWLSPRNQRLFAIELNAALAKPDLHDLEALLEAWRATAEIEADEEFRAEVERRRSGKFNPADEWLRNQATR